MPIAVAADDGHLYAVMGRRDGVDVSSHIAALLKAPQRPFSASSALDRSSQKARPKFRVLSTFLIFSALTASGCGYASVSYSPPFAPVEFSIDTNGTVSVHGDVKLVTPLGEFSVNAGIFKNLRSHPNSLLVVIRHKQNGELFDVGYRINTREQLSVVLDGHIHLTISNSRVFVDASRGRVRNVKISSLNPRPKPNTARSAASRRPAPVILFTDPLTLGSHPGGPQFYPVYGYGYASDGFHMYGDCGRYELRTVTTRNTDISVTVTWLRGDPLAEFGILFRNTYIYWMRGNGKWGVYKDISDRVPPTPSRFIHIGVNRLRVHMKGPHIEFYIDGRKLGSINDASSLSGDMGLYAYGGNSPRNEVVFTNLVVRRVS